MSIREHHPAERFIANETFTELLFVEDQLENVLEKAPGQIKGTCLRLLKSGGKRIRPLLTLLSGMCFAPLTPKMIQAAVAAELIHMASLVHDDVIDHSTTRRGNPTINALHGDHAAVLTGDYLFAEAFHILSSNQLLSSMEFLVEAIQAMCDGEVDQAEEKFEPAVDIGMYFNRIAKKTGILLSACCQAGGSIAGCNEHELALLKEYGLNIGYAYQITDDILDFHGDAHTLGKPSGADITNGHITLPVIFLLNNSVYGHWLREIIHTRKITVQGLQSIKEALIHSGSFELAFEAAAQCVDIAKASLDPIPASPYKMRLIAIADSILNRKM